MLFMVVPGSPTFAIIGKIHSASDIFGKSERIAAPE
jgi:hypothetical protein